MAYELFNSKAPWIMALLMRDFDLVLDDGCAILGNIGHECGGFKLFQEQKPLVPGSRGGFGWAQWTGPRRRAFEAYCARNKLDPKSDQANYGFLFVELSGSESAAITKVKAAKGLRAKVRAFEAAFERAGVKHYDSRDTWAIRARAAWDAVDGKPTIPEWAQKPASGSKPSPAQSPEAERQEQPAAEPEPKRGILAILFEIIGKLLRGKS